MIGGIHQTLRAGAKSGTMESIVEVFMTVRRIRVWVLCAFLFFVCFLGWVISVIRVIHVLFFNPTNQSTNQPNNRPNPYAPTLFMFEVVVKVIDAGFAFNKSAYW